MSVGAGQIAEWFTVLPDLVVVLTLPNAVTLSYPACCGGLQPENYLCCYFLAVILLLL